MCWHLLPSFEVLSFVHRLQREHMDTTDTAALEHVLKSTGKPTLLNMIPPWGHSQVPVTCVSRWCKYLFFVNSVLEKKLHPRQNTALLLEWVHTSNSLTWIPTKTARKQGCIYMRSVSLSSTQASNTFTAEFHIYMLSIYC